ncbi:transposase [Paraburkholderia sp. BCC1885]|uniref:transposase n=1 Tax=Paraburkholderia sp. BCC1885 TaxID=2562669 RepID=UPI001181C96E|nr:transposase [Paraburkholderia sp. BCC1885]
MNTPESTQAHSPMPSALFLDDLTDAQWERVVPLLPELNQHVVRRGRPCVNLRGVVNSVLWVLRSGRPWNAMPEHYPPYQTSHRYYLRWRETGVLSEIAFELFRTDAVLTRYVSRKRDPNERHESKAA